MLTTAQIQQFHDNGFLVLEQLVPVSETEKLRTAASAIIKEFDVNQHRSIFSTDDQDRGRDAYFYESSENIHCFLEQGAVDNHGNLVKPLEQSINKIGHAMHDLNPVFNAFCRLPVFAGLLRDIGYLQPALWQTMYIFKQPKIGGEVRWHQDASYLVTTPSSVTGVWVAIEDAHRDNGCLWVQPGGHKSPLREVFALNTDGTEAKLKTLNDTPWPQLDEAIPVEVSAGSVVIFDDHMPHFSSQNRSNHSRHAFTMHVAERESQWSARNWLQRPTLGDFLL